MRSLVTGIFLLGLASNANATYITSGLTITNDSNGLEWLQLSATKNLSYADALSANQADGWRYATNDEVVGMFNDFFPTFIPNNANGISNYSYSGSSYYYSCGWSSCSGSTSYTTPDSAYTWAQQDADIANWNSIFYPTTSGYTYSGRSSSTLGFYRDELGILRELGVGTSSYYYGGSYSSSWGGSSTVFGPDTLYTFADDYFGNLGTFLVRTNSVPEPTSLVLLGLGLAGLSFTRRRRFTQSHNTIEI